MKRDSIDESAIDAYVAKVIANAPPLTDEQRIRLAELLRPVRVSTADVETVEFGAAS
jgi:hypothetical protein